MLANWGGTRVGIVLLGVLLVGILRDNLEVVVCEVFVESGGAIVEGDVTDACVVK